MKASVYRRYGPPEVLSVEEVATPSPGPGEILVKVEAASVSTADWRLRAAAFPGIMWLPGRLMFGLFRPKAPVLGADFAGRVVEAGPEVTGFAPGDAVYGFSGAGAHAEYLTIAETAAVAPRPAGLSAAEAAALPFGGLAALVFLRDFAGLRPGERVLVVGASGGVGSYAVQIARAMGAEVTGVASAENHAMVRELGADDVIDYRARPVSDWGGTYDVILDTVGATRFRDVRRLLTANGRFVPLNFGLGDMLQALRARLLGGPKVVVGVNGDSRADLDRLSDLVAEGRVRPVIDRRYPLDRVREAYARVEGRHKRGAVILDLEADSA